MRCRILHESPGRIRVHLMQSRMTLAQADRLEYYLRAQSCVKDATVFDRTCDAVIRFQGPREDVIAALGHFSWADPALAELVPEHTGRALQREFEDRLAGLVMRRYLRKLLVPAPIRHVLTVFRAFPFLREGIALLFRGKIQVPLLDAVAIGASLLQGDFETAGSVMFLLKVGAILEEWTYRKSVNDLARTMSLQVDKVWRLGPEGEKLVPVGDVAVGDTVIVRTGSMIPLDGKVSAGEAMVNQSSMTGESLPVRKTEGSYVYAGTVVEEGECALRVEKATGSGRYDRIVRMIEESEKLKSETESKAAHLADSLVPYSLGGTALAYLLTRNVTRAMSVLMVDFSCALKLSMPIAVLSAMRECGTHGITVKGGKFLEAAAESTTIVFDKTGTLTHARPRVAEVVPFGERDEAECLRLAACLEEHYPHPMANAVVEEAERRGLRHEERHSRVEYVVAHGISSRVDEQKVIIGSYHFVFEDEGVTQSPEETQKLESLRTDCSHLYLAMDGALAAVILVEDPLRSEAPAVVRQLHDLGVSRVVMMTGDNERTARSVAAAVGVDDYRSEVLPEDKAAFIRAEHEAGRKVIMIGDGVNDSPALSEADAGVAIAAGAAIAREIADITIAADDLGVLLLLRRISTGLMDRIGRDYRFIISFNLALIALGFAGILPPAASALLHNASTIAVALGNMTDLLGE